MPKCENSLPKVYQDRIPAINKINVRKSIKELKWYGKGAQK
jgi:hypothetical protein